MLADPARLPRDRCQRRHLRLAGFACGHRGAEWWNFAACGLLYGWRCGAAAGNDALAGPFGFGPAFAAIVARLVRVASSRGRGLRASGSAPAIYRGAACRRSSRRAPERSTLERSLAGRVASTHVGGVDGVGSATRRIEERECSRSMSRSWVPVRPASSPPTTPGFRGLSTAVIDALPEPGGQVTAMYPEKAIFDVAGLPGDQGPGPRRQPGRAGRAVQPQLPARRAGGQADLPRTASRCLGLSDGTDRAAARCSSPAGWAASPPARCRPRTTFNGAGILFFVPATWTTWPATTWSSSAAATRPSTGRWRCSAGQVGDAGAPPGQVPRARRRLSPGSRRCRCGSS